MASNNRAIVYKNRGEYELALDDLNQAALINPSSSSVHFNRSVIFALQGLYQKALQDALAAQELGEKDISGHIKQLKDLISSKR